VIRVSVGRSSRARLGVSRARVLAEWRLGKQVASVDLRDVKGLPGAHNHQNACAAWAVARSLGLGPRGIEAAMRSYPGPAAPQPAHRREGRRGLC
jgi:UDP-N-acetylmuramoylalanine--D-glutamate ligase